MHNCKYKRPCNLRQPGRTYWPVPRSLPQSVATELLLTGLVTSALPALAAAQTVQYPPAPTANIVDDYHGTKFPDPYRRLEDPDAPATRAWHEADNHLTQA